MLTTYGYCVSYIIYLEKNIFCYRLARKAFMKVSDCNTISVFNKFNTFKVVCYFTVIF